MNPKRGSHGKHSLKDVFCYESIERSQRDEFAIMVDTVVSCDCVTATEMAIQRHAVCSQCKLYTNADWSKIFQSETWVLTDYAALAYTERVQK